MKSVDRAAWFILLICIVCVLASDCKAEENNYFFAEVAVAKFVNACEHCAYPDGDWPAYFMFGYHFQARHNVYIESGVMHRSNWDIGFPNKGEAGAKEYNRDGIFTRVRYRF